MKQVILDGLSFAVESNGNICSKNFQIFEDEDEDENEDKDCQYPLASCPITWAYCKISGESSWNASSTMARVLGVDEQIMWDFIFSFAGDREKSKPEWKEFCQQIKADYQQYFLTRDK